MLGGKFSEDFNKIKNSYLPKKAKKWLVADLVISNLEAPASNRGKPSKNKILVYTKKKPLKVLKEMNIDFLNMANNHIMDYGYEGAKDTKKILDKMKIKYAGCGKNLKESRKPAVFKKKGKIITVNSYSFTKEFVEPVKAATKKMPGVAPIKISYIKEDVRCVKNKLNSGLAIVSLHWGEGKSHNPRPEQIETARKIIDCGADLVIGHHAHCLQGYEVYRGKPIFYGIGNFISSPYMKDEKSHLNYENKGKLRIRYARERNTAIFNVIFGKRGVKSVSVLPLLQKKGKPVMTLPDSKTKNRILKGIEKSSRRIKSKYYKSLIFPVVRRLDELMRMYDDIKDEGLKKDFFSFSTFARIITKLLKGKHFS